MTQDLLIHVPLVLLTRAEDGTCLARRHWLVHPERGAAFRVRRSGRGRLDLQPVCAPNALAARALLAQAGPAYEIREIPLAFLRHGERRLEEARTPLAA